MKYEVVNYIISMLREFRRIYTPLYHTLLKSAHHTSIHTTLHKNQNVTPFKHHHADHCSNCRFLLAGTRTLKVLNIVETVNPRATIIRVVEESKPGKRAAMYTGLAYVDTEITVFADDDALYGPAVLKSLIMPFKDPAMGGCGTRQIARPKADKFCFSDIMMVSSE